MKKNLLNKLWLRVGMIVAIMTTALSGTVWAETVTMAYSGSATTNMTGNNDAATVGLTATDWSVVGAKGSASNLPGLNKDGSIRLYYNASGSNTITVSSLKNYTISSITVTYKSASNNNGTITVGNDVITGTGTDTEKTYSINATSFVIGNGYTANTQVHITKVVINYSTGGIPTVDTPVISGNESFLNSTEVTISCGTSGATIKYSTNDGSTWIDYTEPFTLTATTTVKAKATKSGMTDSEVASKTFTKATVMTVAEAIAATPATGTSSAVFIQGVVSAFYKTSIVDDSNNYRYYISDDGTTTNQLLVYKGAGLNQVTFTNADDLLVGDEVIIYGSLTTFNNAAEVAAGNYLVSFNRPAAPVVPVINAEATLSLAYDATSGEIAYTVENPVEGTSLTATSSETWLTIGTISETSVAFTCTANEDVEDRTATVTLTYGEVTKNVIVTQAAYEAPVADYATLPFSWSGGVKNDLLALAGVTANGLGSDYAEGNAPYLVKLDGTGDYIQVKTDSRPGVVTIGVKMIGGSTTSTITVQESADGETFSDVQALTISGAQNDVLTLSTTTEFAETSRYVRLYFTKGSNVGVGPISIAAYAPIVLSDYTLTIDDPANVTITATYGEEVLDNGDNAEVTQGTEVSLVVTPASGYDFESLTIAGEEEGQTITPTATSTEGVYTFNMPSYDVTVSATVVEHVESVEATYTLATTITSGKTYVIANADGTKVMGGQNTNNRAAVDATLNGTTLTAADACEFTIETMSAGDEDYDYYVSIYDANEEGYLYAASGSNNYLKTQETNNDNGKWGVKINTETGVATVIAQGKNNRNVMQYNGSNGSSLFSCYQYANQTAIKLYEKVEASTSQTVKVSDAGYATFVAEADLEIPTGVEVFAVKVNEGVTSVQLISVTDGVPSGNAVLVRASAGDYVFPYATEAVDAISENDLQAATVAFNPTAANTIYCLAKKGEPARVGFYPVATTVTIPAGKAYLEVTGGEAKAFYGFEEDDPTGIDNLNANVNANEAAIYNLSGQMVNGKLPKGIYIVNGKKILK